MRVKRARLLRAVLAVAGSSVVLTAPLTGTWARPVQAATPTVTLAANVIRGIDKLTPTGRIDPSRTLSLGVGLQHPDPAAEQAYLAAEYDPQSALFEQFLTPDEYNSRFGVTAQQLNAAVGWLQAGGLAAQTIPGTTDYLLASGPASRVEQLLAVSINNYTYKGVSFYANTTAPTVPTSLGVDAVLGLNSLEGPRLFQHQTTQRPVARPAPAAIGPTTNTGFSTPPVLWDVYHQPSNNTGQGQSMAIFGWGVTDGTQSDLTRFELEYKLPAINLTIHHYGTEPITDTGGAVEWRLDTQASTGMAPGVAGETLYFGNAGTDADLVAAYKAWVNDAHGPLQGSSSFGGCEQAPGTDAFGGGPGNPAGLVILANPNQAQYEKALRQAVMEGRTMFASTGDTGSSCPAVSVNLNGVGNEVVPLLNYPAASSYAVAVGGTVLYYNPGTATTPATRALEYTWNYSGGGTSPFIAAGSYQQLIPSPGLLAHCISKPDGSSYSPPSPPCRGIPDVAAQSGDVITNGYTITVDGANDQQGAGTSLSSPLWLGMWTRIQAASKSVRGNGFANPKLYRDAAAHPADFFDIGGTNSQTFPNCNGPIAPVNCSHPGWDYAAGWGAPDVTAIMKHIDGRTAPTRPTKPAPPPTSIPPALNACAPLWTAPPGGDSFLGQTGANPQLALIKGTIIVSPDGKNLVTTLIVQNLTKQVPPPGAANEYYFVWAFKNARYFSVVQVDSAGTVTFGDGSVQGNLYQNRRGSGTDTGQFNPGPNGTVVVNVPMSAVGNPVLGDILASPTGQTKVLVGVPQVGGFIEPAHQGGPQYDYKVGETCNGVQVA
jgi:pseudomonalisin